MLKVCSRRIATRKQIFCFWYKLYLYHTYNCKMRFKNAILCFLDNLPASELLVWTFRNLLAVPSSFSRICTLQLKSWVSLLCSTPMKMERIESSETSALKVQTPGDYPKATIWHSTHGESLKYNFILLLCNNVGSHHNRAGVIQMYWITHKMAVYNQIM